MPALRHPLLARPLLGFVLPLVVAFCTAVPAVAAFTFDDVAQRARELALAPYKKPGTPQPKELQSLNYDQYRDIRFRPDHAWWRNAKLPFELMFFHQGAIYDNRVRINEVTADGAREIRFDPSMFDYGANRIDAAKLNDVGFAGFRVHYALNVPRYKDEVLVFLGASYFGRGISALHRILGRAARTRGKGVADICAAGFPAHGRRLSLHPETGGQHRDRCAYAIVSARERNFAWRGAA